MLIYFDKLLWHDNHNAYGSNTAKQHCLVLQDIISIEVAVSLQSLFIENVLNKSSALHIKQ